MTGTGPQVCSSSVNDYFVTLSFLGHLPGLFVVPVAFLTMSDKLLKFIQLYQDNEQTNHE